MKKGFKFAYTVKSISDGRIVSRNFMDLDKARQEYFYRKNADPGCTKSVLFVNSNNTVFYSFGI